MSGIVIVAWNIKIKDLVPYRSSAMVKHVCSVMRTCRKGTYPNMGGTVLICIGSFNSHNNFGMEGTWYFHFIDKKTGSQSKSFA